MMQLPLMSWPSRALAALVVLSAAFATGWAMHARYAAAKALQQQVQTSEDARETERLANRNTARVNDELTKNRLATARRTGDLERRLREQADASPGPAPGCPSRSDDTRAPSNYFQTRLEEILSRSPPKRTP